MTAETADPSGHVIICGYNSLASRMAEELTARYGLAVTAIVPPEARGRVAQLLATPGVRVLERAELNEEAFLAAGLPGARAVAVVHEDDLGNVHAALRAQDIRPDIRLVIAIFNDTLGSQLGRFIGPDCEILSQAATAAPSLVAAALGEVGPDVVTLPGDQVVYRTVRDRVTAGQIICGLAASVDARTPSLLPPDDPAAGVVLAAGDAPPRNPMSRRRQRRLTAPLRFARRMFGTRNGLAFAVLLAAAVTGYALLAAAVRSISLANALYLTLTDGAGAAVTETSLSWPVKTAQILLTLLSLAFVPVATAAFLASRIDKSARDQLQPVDHVIVAGLGRVGTRVLGLLHDLGIEAVAIDSDPAATGIPLAAQQDVRVIIGEPQREEILLAAGITSCQALISVTNSDTVNLEAALTARALTGKPRIVVRLYDDDLAARLQPKISRTVSRSTSYLAATEFAAALLSHQVLRTIAVGRHVLMLVRVRPGRPEGQISGRPVSELNLPGELLVVGVRSGRGKIAWSPPPGYLVQPRDELFVVATRAGLSGLLRREVNLPPAESGAAPVAGS